MKANSWLPYWIMTQGMKHLESMNTSQEKRLYSICTPGARHIASPKEIFTEHLWSRVTLSAFPKKSN